MDVSQAGSPSLSPDPDVMPSAARATKLPDGISPDVPAELALSDEQIMQRVQESVARVPGRRLPKRLRPRPPQGLDLPTECKGAGCLTRMRLAKIAEDCKGDDRCKNEQIEKWKEEIRKRPAQM